MTTLQANNAVANSTREGTKVLYTARTHTSGGRRGGVSRSDDDRLDLKFSNATRGNIDVTLNLV